MNKKEGSMRPVYDAQSLNLSHLNPVKVSYDPKNIHTEAIQVTPENIGKLSLEFEEELFYDGSGRPYFVFSAKRFDAGEPDGQQPPNELYVRLTDWIIPLWDELHIFRDVVFQNTFVIDFTRESEGAHVAKSVALARPYVDGPVSIPPNSVRSMSGVVENPDETNVMPRTAEYKANDPVRIKETGNHGIVTVTGVEKDGRYAVEVLDFEGKHSDHFPEELERI